jgi:acyl carrier protein
LLEDPTALGVWKLLAERYPDRRVAPETSTQLDLNIDSLGWVNLTLEIGEKTGVELDEEAIERIDTVRDLLREVASGASGTLHHVSPFERPEEVLDDRQKRWLEPLGPARSAMARGMFALNRMMMRGPFSLQVEGLENLPDRGPFIIAPNHVSYLDAFAVAAALDYSVLRRTYWAEHYVRVEQRDERVDVTVARCGEEGVDDLSLGGEVGLLALRVARAHHVQAHPPARSGPALTWLSNRPSATGPGRSSSRTG